MLDWSKLKIKGTMRNWGQGLEKLLLCSGTIKRSREGGRLLGQGRFSVLLSGFFVFILRQGRIEFVWMQMGSVEG